MAISSWIWAVNIPSWFGIISIAGQNVSNTASKLHFAVFLKEPSVYGPGRIEPLLPAATSYTVNITEVKCEVFFRRP